MEAETRTVARLLEKALKAQYPDVFVQAERVYAPGEIWLLDLSWSRPTDRAIYVVIESFDHLSTSDSDLQLEGPGGSVEERVRWYLDEISRLRTG